MSEISSLDSGQKKKVYLCKLNIIIYKKLIKLTNSNLNHTM